VAWIKKNSATALLNRSCSGWVGLDLSRRRPFWINEWTRPAAVRTEQLHCTARCWSTEPGKKGQQEAKETGRPSPRERAGAGRLAVAACPVTYPAPQDGDGSVARERETTWRAGGCTALFFFLWLAGTGAACRPTDRPAACWKEARRHVLSSRGTDAELSTAKNPSTSISINLYTDAILNSHPSLSSFGSHMDFTQYTL
jgi:hypothetical protein